MGNLNIEIIQSDNNASKVESNQEKNIIIFGLSESVYGRQDDLEFSVYDILDAITDYCESGPMDHSYRHQTSMTRLGKTNSKRDNSRPRPVLVLFSSL